MYLFKGFKVDDYLKSCGFSYVNYKRQRARSDGGWCKKGLITEYAKPKLKTNSRAHDALNFRNEVREKRGKVLNVNGLKAKSAKQNSEGERMSEGWKLAIKFK